MTPAVSANASAAKRPQLIQTDITRHVQVTFGASKYDGASKTLELPILIKNTSKESVYGPLRLEIPMIGGVFEWEDAQADKKVAPEILNASNAKSSAGAQFDFTPALGNDGVLRPGAVTSPVLLKLRLVDPNRVPTIELKVIGETEKQD